MAKPDPTLDRITASFADFDVARSRGGYLLTDRRNGNPIARLKPFSGSEDFELFYWSEVRGAWRTFGNFGRMKLTLQDAHEIVHADPMFQIRRAR